MMSLKQMSRDLFFIAQTENYIDIDDIDRMLCCYTNLVIHTHQWRSSMDTCLSIIVSGSSFLCIICIPMYDLYIIEQLH